MTTKMKGLFKGLRYISQIFEEDKDQEMQIGFPTDVKHVAHIGWDGPSAAVDSSPSWMKEFKSPTGFQSAPLDSNGNNREDPEIKWVSEDSKKGNRSTDSPEVPRSSRRHNSSDNNNNNSNDSPRKKDSSTKSRQSRRNHSKDSSEGSVKSGRGQDNESGQPSDSPSRAHPDLAKKSRRKKSKESDGGGSTRSSRAKDSDGGSTRSRSKDSEGSGSSRSRSKLAPCGPSAYSDPGRTPGSPIGPMSSMHDEEKERRVIS